MTESASPDDKPFPLTMAREGDRVRIVTLRGGAGLVRRLTEMGLNVGAEVTVAQQQGETLVLIRGDTRLGLGVGASQRVMVTPAA